MKHVEGLAAFFGVPVNYFFNDDVATRVDTELDFIVALRNAPVRDIAIRASGLSAESLSAIAGMIEHARRLEGLPGHPKTVTGPIGRLKQLNRRSSVGELPAGVASSAPCAL